MRPLWPVKKSSRISLTARPHCAGFTMLEMMVVMAIVLGITAIVIAYVPQFRDRSNLDLIAQEIAINIRAAQVYASGGRTGTLGTDRPSYGVHFDFSESTRFFIFENKGEPFYSNDEGDKIIPGDDFNLRGTEIYKLFLDDGQEIDAGTLDITYTRPRSQAVICLNQSCGEIHDLGLVIKAVRSGNTKGIRVRANGQIGVYNTD